MKAVGTYEAKTRLSELISRVNKTGEQIAITSHGNIVALLSPAPSSNTRRGDFVQAIERWKIARKGTSLNGLRVRDLINAGRR